MSIENIFYEIQGKRYMMFEVPMTQGNAEREQAKYKKFGGICQGIKEISRGGLFNSSFAIVKVLIPEENILAYENA